MAGPKEDYILMMVGGLTLDPTTKMPIVVLKDPDNKINLPIWIGHLEAASMATEIEGIKPQRPMTHDLLRNVLGELGATVEAVEITELRENTYFARIEVKTREG
ncbi:MAG TPA: bifunctional nuclease family protein, partial [Candidatus Binataceae bacterium]|nr:bifunctional nuclease family protein [Candidatus Binataceae bacterium]